MPSIGILLVEPFRKDSQNISQKVQVKILKKYQERCKTKPEEFLSLFKELQEYSLRLSAINEWWNWISPTTVGKIPRYDTLFYFCAIDMEYSYHGEHEIQNILAAEIEQNWIFLDRFLAQYHSPKPSFVVLPSQLYELMRLASHKEYSELKKFASDRELFGIEQWIPSVSIYSDGCVSTLPGDFQYPEDVEKMPSKTARFHDNKTMEEFNNSGKELNRIEHRSYWCKIIIKGSSNEQQNSNNENNSDSAYLRLSLGHKIPLQIDRFEHKNLTAKL